ncbi:MAG: helix-turn-helix domain-containing protein [Actinobacteria bacterium]|nr:helix-turn-helix domain-containing protein [Actinomycetota bacterium]
MIDSGPWVARARPGPPAKPLSLSREQRAAVEAAIRPGKTELRVARRAQALLLMADGVSTYDTAKLIGVHVRTVFEWRERFRNADDPAAKLADAPRSGRPRALSPTPTPRG